MTPTTARVIYPGLPDPLTQGDLQQLFNPSFDERKWAPSVARTPASPVALLVHLKIFQTIGRFLPAADVPLAAVEYMARRMAVESGATLIFPDRTLYRHRHAILKRLKVVAWGAEARAVTVPSTSCCTSSLKPPLGFVAVNATKPSFRRARAEHQYAAACPAHAALSGPWTGLGFLDRQGLCKVLHG